MIRREILLPAPREDVWEALTEAERLADWFANDVDIDLRPGGGASFRWSNGEERHATFTEVEPEHRLAFEWEDEGAVEFTLDDDGDGDRAHRRAAHDAAGSGEAPGDARRRRARRVGAAGPRDAVPAHRGRRR